MISVPIWLLVLVGVALVLIAHHRGYEVGYDRRTRWNDSGRSIAWEAHYREQAYANSLRDYIERASLTDEAFMDIGSIPKAPAARFIGLPRLGDSA